MSKEFDALDKIFVDLDPKLVLSARLVTWAKMLEHRGSPIDWSVVGPELIAETFGGIVDLERRVVALESFADTARNTSL